MTDQLPAKMLEPLETQLLAVSPGTPAEQMRYLHDRFDFYKAALKQLEQQFKDALIDWMNENGDLELDDTRRLYVKTDKRIKCRSNRATIEALIEATNGDFDKVVECLASGAFKQGACKPILGDAWAEHFDVEDVEVVKDGKNTKKKSVALADDKFTRANAQTGE